MKPIIASVPNEFHIEQNIIGNPLTDILTLLPKTPSFTPIWHYTEECMIALQTRHSDFLLPEEMKLLHHLMSLKNEAFTWSDLEHSSFKMEYFPPVKIPVIPHTPWIEHNIPIPPGIYDKVCMIICKKIESGIYECSNSAYCSCWFCMLKKDRKVLHIVHILEPLNRVTIKHSSVTPIPEHLAEQFAGQSCGAVLNLYVGYDKHLIKESSHDFTTFQTPYGAMCLIMLLMGWMNLVPIFHDDICHILQPKILTYTIPYIDDVPVKGPVTHYLLPDSSYKTIPVNSGIRHFVWEHFQNINRIVQHMKYSGSTFLGTKSMMCIENFIIISHYCMPDGRKLDTGKVDVIHNWGTCHTLSKVQTLLGTVGLMHIYIWNRASHPCFE